MKNYNRAFVDKATNAANIAGVDFAVMWACEAALESGYGTSALAVVDNNLFGMKQHSHPVYGTHVLPTREYINSKWIVVNANWVSYPDWASCFKDRLATLTRLSTEKGFEHYMDALNATDAITFVKCVSAKWATDPARADKVIAIYNMYLGEAPPTPAADSVPATAPVVPVAPIPPVPVHDPFQCVKDTLKRVLDGFRKNPNA